MNEFTHTHLSGYWAIKHTGYENGIETYVFLPSAHITAMHWAHMICLKPNFTHEKEKHSCQPSAHSVTSVSQLLAIKLLYICLSHIYLIYIFFSYEKWLRQNQIYSLTIGYWLKSHVNKISVTLKWTAGEQICFPSQNS